MILGFSEREFWRATLRSIAVLAGQHYRRQEEQALAARFGENLAMADEYEAEAARWRANQRLDRR